MNKKFRFYIWMLQGYLKKHTLKIILIIVSVSVIITALMLWIPKVSTPDTDIFIEGVVGRYTIKQLPQSVLEYISYGLVYTDDQGYPIPQAAENVENDNNGKTFTIRLKDNIYWHNGAKLTSQDLAYNLADVEIEKPDDKTLVFKLKDSYAPFPTLLTGPLLKVTPNDEVLGIGAYRIQRLEYRQSQHLTSIDLYSEKKSPQTIRIKFYQTEQDAIQAYKLGQIQGIQLSNDSPLKLWNNTTVYKKIIQRRYVGVFFKMDDPIVGGVKDPVVRQILSLATKPVPDEQPFAGPFPTNSWASTNIENKFQYDLEKAKAELQKYLKARKSDSLEVTITTLPAFQKVSQEIANNWQEAGIKANIEVVNKIPEKFQVLIAAQEIPTDPDQYSFWHSTQKTSNITAYNNLRVDKDLEDARKTVDLKFRKEKYADFQKQLSDDLPVIYLYQPYQLYALQNKFNTDEVKKLKKFVK
jgi:peptide/nickel transport system substrate-binding protein